jgi:hypothetical protein
VLDRLRDLRRDGGHELDLVGGELPRRDRSHVERAGKALAGNDRHREDRLVLILRQVGEELEARVEMRLRRQHNRAELRSGRAGDAFPWAHARALRHLLDLRPVRGAQHELAAPLVVEVDEAGVRSEHVGDLARDEREHLLQVERRVDRRDRLGQQPQMAFSYVHSNS